jgi:hypothetical protein
MVGDTTMDITIAGITTTGIVGTGVITTAGVTTIDITPGTIVGIPMVTAALTDKTVRE